MKLPVLSRNPKLYSTRRLVEAAAFVLLIFVLAAAQATLDPDIIWSRVPLPAAALRLPTAGKTVPACHTCELTMAAGASSIRHAHAHCPRCGEVLHRRKPHSIERTWALIFASLICLAPANLLPIMPVTSLGQIQSDTERCDYSGETGV